MKNAVLDFRASAETVDALKKLGFNVIKTHHMTTVYATICGHVDIMIHKLKENLLVAEPTVYDYFCKSLRNVTIVRGKTALNAKYPFDIAYNAARVGKNLFCLEKYTDKVILDYANENGVNIVNTKQGYAKCSICIVSDEAIITSDKNIAAAAEKNKIDVLTVDDSSIKLIGFEHGFIGGATGLIAENVLAINGDINYHTDCNRILDFCKSHKTEIISLNSGPIIDIGSILII